MCRDRDESFHAMEMHGTRDWKSWLASAGSHLSKGFAARKGIWAPHSFTFKARQDLLSHEHNALREACVSRASQGQPTHGRDVICLVKNYVHDDRVSQALLVLPVAFRPRLVGPYPSTMTPTIRCNKETTRNYTALAAELRQPHCHYPRAADYIEGLTQSREGEQVRLPWFSWLRRVVSSPTPLNTPTANQYYPHLPQILWTLQSDLRW
jgi:hypothetical protein